MKNSYLVLAALGLSLTTNAFADDKVRYHTDTTAETDVDGNTKRDSTTSTIDSAGTERNTQTEEKASLKRDGSRTSTTSSTSSTDPKGLMNKTWSDSSTKVQADTKGNIEKNSTSRGVDSAGTELSESKNLKTTTKSDGTRETVATDKVIHDPKGLMNKNTVESTDTTKKLPDGKTTHHHQKVVNGTTVDDDMQTAE